MRVVFMGTPDFAAASLKSLLDAGHEITGVFTQPDRAKGRGMKLVVSPVKELALQHGLKVFQPTKMRDGTTLESMRACRPDLVAVVAYGRLLPKEMLNTPPLGCVNLHASLLPQLRGAAPIQWAVARGYAETGVTTMNMAPDLDAGDILMYNKTLVSAQDTAGTLHDRLRDAGADLLIQTLDGLSKGEIIPVPQDHAKATFAPIIRKEDGRVDFTKPLAQIECLIRGMHPWPCAFSGDIKIHRAEPAGELSQASPGTVIDKTCVVCGDGGVLRLLEIQAAGGKRMKAEDYVRGRTLSIGS